MSKKTKPSQADIDLFIGAVKGTKVLKHDKISLTKGKAPVKRRKFSVDHPHEEDDNPHVLPPFTQSNYLEDIDSDTSMSYKVTGMANKTLRKLQKGQYNVQAILDLHGKTILAAEDSVRKFLQECMQAHIQVALIIHGKGFQQKSPILKNKLNHWLRDVPGIIAFCSAAKRDGGQGAVYVLFRRN